MSFRCSGAGNTTAEPLVERAALYTGDVASTGAASKATLLFSEGSQLRLNANTVVELTAPTGGASGSPSLFRLVKGEVYAQARSAVSAQTLSATASVRGTVFDLKVDDQGASTLTVVEGAVEFFNKLGTVTVGESQQSVARPGQAPTKPLTIPNAGFIIEWTLDLDRAVIPREKFFVSLDRQIVSAELGRRAARLRAAPDDALAHRDYADALFDNRQYGDALREYQMTDRLEARQPVTLTRIGDTLLELNHLDEAEASYRAALAIAPAHTVAANPAATSPVAANSSGAGGERRAAGWVEADYPMLRRTPTSSGHFAAPRTADNFRTVAMVRDGDDAYESALVGLAWLALTRERPAQAQTLAQQALSDGTTVQPTAAAAGPMADSAEARIAMGLALMRQPGKLSEAQAAFLAAQDLQPARYRYQARAWLALVYLGQDDAVAALREAKAATLAAPNSALAHGNLALVYFFNGKPNEAVHEGRVATQLNPKSVAARIALGQAQLAQGDVDAAKSSAAQAVALDPELPQGRYLLGVADAQRRDYVHAASELRASLRLSPDFLPAAATLARVYTRMGREPEAVALLTDMAPRHRQNDRVLGALGEVLYEQGKPLDAVTQFERAIKQRPNSALYYAGLARALLQANRLSGAIQAAQNAIELAPDVAQYHALLGLAFDFSKVISVSFQAEREYRSALSLDPQNALARAMLGLHASDPTTTVDTFSQAFLFDPEVSQQMMRGGIDSELTYSGGNDAQRSLGLLHRDVGGDGKFHFLGGLGDNRDNGDTGQINDTSHQRVLRQDSTYVLSPATNLYFDITSVRTRQGLPGLVHSPFGDDPDAHSNFNFDQGVLALRQRVRRADYLSFSLTGQRLRNALTNGSQPASLPFPLPLGVPFSFTGQSFNNRSLIGEVRGDITLNQSPERLTVLTAGVARAQLKPDLTTGLLALVNPPRATVVLPALNSRGDEHFSAEYVQLQTRWHNRLSLVAQLRQQHDERRLTSTGGNVAAGTSSSLRTIESHLLPSLLTTYQVDPHTLLRLLVNNRAGTTNLALAPTESRLTTEPDILLTGAPGTARTIELDAERYLSHNRFVKVFVFTAVAHNLDLGGDAHVFAFQVQSPFQLDRLAQTGLGVRYAQPITRNLNGEISFITNRTTNRTAGQPFSGQAAPYYPNNSARLDLNYIDPSGNKVTLVASRVGAFFQDAPNVVWPGAVDGASAIWSPNLSQRRGVQRIHSAARSVPRPFQRLRSSVRHAQRHRRGRQFREWYQADIGRCDAAVLDGCANVD